MEIEYVTEEPAIYDPNYIIFKRIFETFKVRNVFPKLQKYCFLKLKCKTLFDMRTYKVGLCDMMIYFGWMK